MKNRYGMDGMTYGVKVDISTGHFELSEYDGEEESEDNAPVNFDQVSPVEKRHLQNKFFALSKS
jgi:hypothetical protein